MELGIIEIGGVPVLACKLGTNWRLEERVNLSRFIVSLNALSIKSQLVECNNKSQTCYERADGS